MKSKIKIISTILTMTFLTGLLEAQGIILGNSPNGGAGFILASDSYVPFGGAIEFTPSQNFSLGSVTVWLIGYTGLDVYGQSNSLYAQIFGDVIAYPDGPHTPGALITFLNIPPTNDGSLTPITLSSPSIILQANIPYWLLLYAGGAQASMEWVGGNNPVGDATYNCSEYFSDYGFYPSSATPAFTINAVPEPGQTAMITLSFFCAGVYALRLRRKFAQGKSDSTRSPRFYKQIQKWCVFMNLLELFFKANRHF